MSILAAAEREDSALGLVLAVVAGLIAVCVAALTGALRLAPPTLEPRVPPARPLTPLVMVLFLGILIWLFVPSLYFQIGQAKPAQPVTPATPMVAEPATPAKAEPATAPATTTAAAGAQGFSPRELVALNAAVPVLAFVGMALGNVVIRPVVGQRLGFGLARVPGGVVWGLVGILLTLPVVYCVMVVTAWVYRLVDYQHPAEHELLQTMDKTPDPLVKYLAVVVAMVIAPLWEELLFRGHVQTLIREGLARLHEGARLAANRSGFPVTGITYDAPAPFATAVGRERPPAFEPWVAIVATSLLFASVHQPWQFPPIFCLSLCFGLAYERTGNLWAPVVMHASFNGLMTAIFLAYGAAN